MLTARLILLFLVTAITSFPAAAAPAPLAGVWLGKLNAGGMELRLGLEVTENPETGLAATFISLDQGNARIPSVRPEIVDRVLTTPLPAIGGVFHGEFDEASDVITGTWEQGGAKIPLVLKRVDRLPTQRRPQEPKPPFPYDSEEVVFTSVKEKHSLAGTLTLPRTPGPHPALVLVTGSGPQDRDETLMGHKPFAVLADAFTRRGLAVLRYDDRGVGKSTGDFASATSADLADDAHAAVVYLQSRDDIDRNQIGVGGHSEGAMLAPMLAASFPDQVAFLVLLAPPAISGEEIIITQGLALERRIGMSEEETQAQADLRRRAIRAAIEATTREEFDAALQAAVDDRLANRPEGEARNAARAEYMTALSAYRTPWFRYFLSFDPTEPLEQIACPVLAVLGEKDMQVIPESNLPPLRATLAAAPADEVRIATLPGLNHLLQTCKTGLPSEYGTIEETIAPAALELITNWIMEQVKAAPK